MSENIKENIGEMLDYQESSDQQLGAKVLALTGFETRQKSIVESSFAKARQSGEKLSGKPSEKRNLSYLSRLEKLIAKRGTHLEQKLWEATIEKRGLLLEEEDITEATWESVRQELRDAGHGYIELTDSSKHEYYEKWRELQRKSLEKWARYLGDEHSPYPIWFKIYAWDGMTKMGHFDLKTSQFQNRNKTTIAPYPEPNPEILAKVFEIVSHYFGDSKKEIYTEEGTRNIPLEKIVQTGNFSKIYSAVITPPEKTEDVHGEWVEYGLGDEDDIALAAQGTGWCVASSAVGGHYLRYGTYGQNNNNRHNKERDANNHSKFILFRLVDPETGVLARDACASIRLDPNGKVAEISGLQEWQSLDDSLVPIVEEKVRSLPGGEKFLEAFADKKMLIILDHKMQNGEDLTKEELIFLYELERPIKALSTYYDTDPRIEELKGEYDIEYCLDKGIDVNHLISHMESGDIGDNLETLLAHGADVDQLVSHMDYCDIVDNLETILTHTTDINHLVSNMDPDIICDNLETFLAHGATIDINHLVARMTFYSIIGNLETLLAHGATIDINQLISDKTIRYLPVELETLFNYGIDFDHLVSNMHPDFITENLETLLAHGADIKQLVLRMSPHSITEKLETLLAHGADVEQLIPRISPYSIPKHLDTLLAYGADIDQLVLRTKPHIVAEYLDAFLAHGATIDIDQLILKIMPQRFIKCIDSLLAHGVDINKIIARMDQGSIDRNRELLRRYGANV